jgi:cyclohexanecarboxylate-CoA ligase
MCSMPTIWGELEARAAEYPNDPVLYDEHGGRLTFGELRDRSERVAAGLHELGIGAESRVTWQLPTRAETVVLAFALARLGAVQNPVIHLYGKRELGFILRQTRAELVIVPGVWRGTDFTARVDELRAELDGPLQVLLTQDGLPEADPAALPPQPTAADAPKVRWIFYTSGTSADPKGVCHTDETVLAAGHAMVFCHALTRDDIGSIGFPIAHAGGPQYLASMLEVGYPALLIERFSPAESFPVMRARGVTVVGGGTAFYSTVLAEQRRQPDKPLLPTLRILTGGGAPKPPQLYEDVLREVGRPILHGLGMTESPCITMGAVTDTDEQRAYTEGAPVPGMEVRIVDGEIQLKGSCCTVGYVDPALNAELFTADGWLRGGDLGHLRVDGHLVVTGRKKDVIIRKGENISAREVEELLLQHPLISDVAVIGLPDAERGELVCAVIEGIAGAPPLEFDAMVGYLRETGLTTQKIPERLEILQALPRNSFSKVSKAELRQHFSNAVGATGATAQ